VEILRRNEGLPGKGPRRTDKSPAGLLHPGRVAPIRTGGLVWRVRGSWSVCGDGRILRELAATVAGARRGTRRGRGRHVDVSSRTSTPRTVHLACQVRRRRLGRCAATNPNPLRELKESDQREPDLDLRRAWACGTRLTNAGPFVVASTVTVRDGGRGGWCSRRVAPSQL